jgi:uncharacterized membrane protein
VTARPDVPTEDPVKPRVTAAIRLAVSAVTGVVVGVVVAAITSWPLLPLLCWDVSCIVFMTWVWRMIRRFDPERTASFSVRQDPTRSTADFVILSAAVASLVAVGFVLRRAAHSEGAAQLGLAALGVVSVGLSWAVVHTVYTLRYARLYYTGGDGGIAFNQEEPPRYSDFAYVAFTVGMTYQVSDTSVQTDEIRRTLLAHALLSFVFGTGILASMINLVANLG